MKRMALATVVALTVFGGAVFAKTTTVQSQFIADRVEIPTGSALTVNLALLGLNKDGEVDRFGEENGSVIMAVIQSEIGTVACGGDENPGSMPNDLIPQTGGFASDVKYVRLKQGNGKACITYQPEVIGATTKIDKVTLFLQERIPTAGGGVSFVRIGQEVTKQITVNPPSIDPRQLRITGFEADTDDKQGGSDADNTDGVFGIMTAGQEGGQITVKAENTDAIGNVTVTLRPMFGGDSYPFTQRMVQNGEAIVTLDSTVIIAGYYYIEATFEGFDGNSVQMVNSDELWVKSTRKADRLSIWSPKQRIAKPDFDKLSQRDASVQAQVGQGTYFVVTILDQYGNETTPENMGDATIRLQDSKGVINGTALNLVIRDNTSSTPVTNDNWLGDGKDEIIQLGTASVVASAIDSKGNPLSITASDAIELTVASNSAYVTPLQAAAMVDAGTEFVFTNSLAVANNEGQLNLGVDPGAIVIISVATGEVLTVYRDTTNAVKALFREATDGANNYLVSDQAGNYAQVLVDVAAIKQAAALKVDIRNAHNQVVTAIKPILVEVDKQYVATIPAVTVKMSDDYGNAITSGSAGGTGEFRANTPNAAVEYVSTGGSDYGTPSKVNGGEARIVYETKGEKEFAGEDQITLNFTKPGLGLSELAISTVVPARRELDAISSLLETDEIPVNSEVAMTVEILDQNGELLKDQGTVITITFGGVAGDTLTPTVRDLAGNFITSGQSLTFANGRQVFVVEAGAIEGQFSFTFADADNKVAAEVETVKVTRKITPIGLENCVSNGNVVVDGVCLPLPNISNQTGDGSAAVLGPDGSIEMTSGTKFNGGLSVDGGDVEQSGTVSISENSKVTWVANIAFDPDDAGEVVDIVVVANYSMGAITTTATQTYYLIGGNEGESIGAIPMPDPNDMAAIESFITGHTIEKSGNLAFLIYEGVFGDQPASGVFAAGAIVARVGYRKGNGVIVFNLEPITLTLLP